MANRITFLVDGFNLYHSVVDLQRNTGDNCRWLDIRSLCSSFLSAIGNTATVDTIYYFSALAQHAEAWRPGTVERHRTYLAALASTGIVSELGKFKAKEANDRCDKCGHFGTMVRHEEKETDVAIACRMLELCLSPTVNGIVVVSGDTDLVPAMRTIGRLSQVPLYAILPYRRYNNAFDNLVVRRFTLAPDHYRRHQLPASITLPSSATIAKPPEWA
jgi:uncharacterized LabA/DUF88 family protein